MSFYELPAEERGYYLFEMRGKSDLPAHFHGAIEFLFVKEGRQEVVLDGERRALTAGTGCFSDSFCVHSYAASDDAVSYVLLGDRAYFEEFFLEHPKLTLPRFFSFSDFDLLEKLCGLCAPFSGGVDRLIFSGVVRILLGVIAKESGLVPRRKDKWENIVCEVLRYAQENLAEELSLEALGMRFGYSREHLSRVLHAYIAENWNDYVNRLRVEKADRLLKEHGEKNVLDILFECGFNSPNTFYRAYKKEFSSRPRRKDINV